MATEFALSRRGFLAGAVGLAAGSRFIPNAKASPAVPAAPHRFVSRPDLRPPVVAVTTTSETVAPGHVLIAPFQITGKAGPGYGALIVDNAGQPIWFKPEATLTAMNLRVQRYRGKPVLTWYEGEVLGAYGGDFVVADQSYREVARVKAGHGEHGDLHEFLLTSRGTALITHLLEHPVRPHVGGRLGERPTDRRRDPGDRRADRQGADRVAQLGARRRSTSRCFQASRTTSPTTST